MNQQQHDNAADSACTAEGSAPPARSRAAKRLSRWSLNLLATGLVVLLGLTVGRTLLQWWRQDERAETAPSSSAGALGFGDRPINDGPAMVEFGDAPVDFHHQSFTGDHDAAIEELVKVCAVTVQTADQWSETPGPFESRLLERLNRQQPIAGERGTWRIFHLDGPISMVVGIREIPAKEHADVGRNIDETNRRVVCWGLALRQAEKSWTLVAAARSLTPTDSATHLPEFPLPPDARRTVALRGMDGSGLIGFAGHGSLPEWKQILTSWFNQHDWVLLDDWRRVGSGFHARYHNNTGLQVDVQLVPDRDRISGLLTATRRR